jgi:hypothetical protein
MTLLEQLFKSARTREVATETAEGFCESNVVAPGEGFEPTRPKRVTGYL